ncbi:Enoyl-[acyl carrier protein] reductase II protein [Ignavibacterium album JCM 16511]|uniref:Enoyl-[acyl carrier protein] reductase II protein n=1 Tax=Ignavibacterium album (strain DSM 19864 / JCM 16511 / NBRC 101810 / Mat9-16) TaxID=945713 RepID=I0AGL2_IGNAJ|nr:nitronate monooxygenase [Ignavibacterium album]AFH48119.1 Enoyl-[acyl carrier protein] reductase II protein [Ignavibacterium album JCM 16511]
MKTKITELFNIDYPIIQAGMVWVSGWKLASAVSNCGGLGLIGSGSMKPDLLREHIRKCKAATINPFGVNIPLLRGDAEELVKVTIEEGVKIVFTSAGHPKKFAREFKENGVKLIHVVPNVKYGLKAQEAGCDAVVGEGVEAGGHNGADQITTFALIPQLVDALEIPVIAAGGIADGRGIVAALALGADGVQIGTRFAATVESSAHDNYKRKILEAKDNDTVLAFKKIGLVRMIKNDFAMRAIKAEEECWDEEKLKDLLGSKRERAGIFEGDEIEGELEAGQGVGLINDIPSVNELMGRLLNEYHSTLKRINSINLS